MAHVGMINLGTVCTETFSYATSNGYDFIRKCSTVYTYAVLYEKHFHTVFM